MPIHGEAGYILEEGEPGVKLAITLHFLATGECYRSLSFGFCMTHNTICVVYAVLGDALCKNFHMKSWSCLQ